MSFESTLPHIYNRVIRRYPETPAIVSSDTAIGMMRAATFEERIVVDGL